MKVKDMVKILQQMGPDNLIVGIWWDSEDIIATAQDMDEELTEEELEDVIARLEEGHDAEYGISWQWIRDTIDYVVEGRRTF